MRDRRTERDTERGWRDTDRNRETERVEMKRQRKTAETERQGRQREIGTLASFSVQIPPYTTFFSPVPLCPVVLPPFLPSDKG